MTRRSVRTPEYSAVLAFVWVWVCWFMCLFVFFCLFASLLSCLFVCLLVCLAVRVCLPNHDCPRAATHPRRGADGQVCVFVCVCVCVCVCLFAGTPTAEFLCLNCDTFSVLTDRASLDHTGA